MNEREAPRHILITGASGAIGRALALEYAAPGVRLTLQGRRGEVLAELATRCREKGAEAETRALDLRDRAALRSWLAELSARCTPDMVFVNAGRNTHIGPEGQGEPFNEVEALIEVNVLASMAVVDAVVPAMRRRGSGQIVLTSSLASYYGLPMTPSYCASKAALRVYGTALRTLLRPDGIRVNVVLPGYVASPMCAAMPGPKPFLWQPERAARYIRRRLAWDWARIGFPFPLTLGVWLLSLLPACVAMPIAKVFGYGR